MTTSRPTPINAHDRWVAAIDPHVERLVQSGITAGEIIAIVLDTDFKAIKPAPPIPAFMVILDERIAHWGTTHGRDPKGRRTNGPNGPNGPASPPAEARLLDLGGRLTDRRRVCRRPEGRPVLRDPRRASRRRVWAQRL
jgi:hypothetical protein